MNRRQRGGAGDHAEVVRGDSYQVSENHHGAILSLRYFHFMVTFIYFIIIFKDFYS